MDSMVERVARALCCDNTGKEVNWGMWTESARAAIEAMMKPTPAMIEAYEGMVCEFRMSEALSAKIAWQAMLSAALSDTEGR